VAPYSPRRVSTSLLAPLHPSLSCATCLQRAISICLTVIPVLYLLYYKSVGFTELKIS
jgi:hypothetical protein